MLNTNFSLTEQFIIDPVLSLQAKPLKNVLSFREKAGHFFRAEVTTRIMALATSIFALIDSIAYLAKGVTSRTYRSEHLKQSAKFLGIALIGSIVAPIWPGICKYFRRGPAPDWGATSEAVQQLLSKAAKWNFNEIWDSASLREHGAFVHKLNSDNSRFAQLTKIHRTDVIYRKIDVTKDGVWPGQKLYPTFYHATTLQGLKGILKSGKIEVRHEKTFRGAFVSTKPETSFGKYILVFNRNIERLSRLNHGFSVENGYWAGFNRDIPVNKSTLNSIVVTNDSDRKLVEELKLKLFGRNIITLNPSVHKSCLYIPKEWPGEDPLSNTIMNTLKKRVQQPQNQIAVKKPQEKRILLAN